MIIVGDGGRKVFRPPAYLCWVLGISQAVLMWSAIFYTLCQAYTKLHVKTTLAKVDEGEFPERSNSKGYA